MNRIAKQLLIATINLILVAVVVVAVWRTDAPEPTCFDGELNQNEQGVDCGGVCEQACLATPELIRLSADPIIVSTATSDQVEVAFTVLNPNPQWGADDVPYTVVFTNASGEEVARRRGTTYLLPLEEHVVVEQAVVVPGFSAGGVTAVVEFGQTSFIEPPEGVDNVELTVQQPIFRRNPDEFNAAELRGVLRNDSPFSYDAIDIFVVVSDRATGKVVSARRTAMRTLTSGERREFVIAWRDPLRLIGDPAILVVPITNLFEDENFLREFGGIENFQRFEW